MLGNVSVAPTLPVVDMERAKRFYHEKLGLKVLNESPAGTVFECGNGTTLLIYQRGATKADHTAAGFQFTDSAAFDAAVSGLKDLGVVFEDYEHARHQDGGRHRHHGAPEGRLAQGHRGEHPGSGVHGLSGATSVAHTLSTTLITSSCWCS